MPADSQPIVECIDAMKSQGASDDFVVALLRQNGWSEKRIYRAFSTWYEARTGRAIPNGGGRIEAARDAFLYLLAFITLGIWAIQLGALLFNVIDRTFPNPAFSYTNGAGAIRSMANELASIIVAFPLFLLVTRAIVRAIERQPERLESPVRKWLTYLALVITASSMICDVVTFLAYFLRGDLDTRFVLKVLTVLLIAGLVFGYYLNSLRDEEVSSARNRLFAIGSVMLVGFGLVVGFVQIGSPVVQRSASQDSRRLFDLSSLAAGLHTGWLTRGAKQFVLPASLEELHKKSDVGADTSIFDPVSGWAYTYTRLEGTGYKLCANFARPSPSDVPGQWRHAAGEVCFALDAAENIQIVQREW